MQVAQLLLAPTKAVTEAIAYLAQLLQLVVVVVVVMRQTQGQTVVQAAVALLTVPEVQVTHQVRLRVKAITAVAALEAVAY